jgi:hypothetical protein
LPSMRLRGARHWRWTEWNLPGPGVKQGGLHHEIRDRTVSTLGTVPAGSTAAKWLHNAAVQLISLKKCNARAPALNCIRQGKTLKTQN